MFDNSLFNAEVYFINSSFYQNTSFFYSEFKGYTSFIESQFMKSVLFSDTSFDETFFNSVSFKGSTTFSSVHFLGSTSFRYSSFMDRVDYRNITFKDEVNFYGSTFYSFASFHNANFGSKVSFQNSTFDSTVSFLETKFSSKVDFSSATFKEEVNILDAILPDTLILSNVKTVEEIDLTYMRLDSLKQVCIIDLYGTDINKIKFDYSRFYILQHAAVYSKAHISHLYEQVLKMQKDKGFIDSYEKADKEYRHFELTYQKPFPSKIWGEMSSFMQRYWWDYGYQKGRIFWWILIFLGGLTIINSIFFRSMNERVYKIENVYKNWHPTETDHHDEKQVDAVKLKRFNALSYIFAPFFYTSLIFFGLRLNIDKINFSNPLGVFYLFVQYALGLICLAYLANFIIG